MSFNRQENSKRQLFFFLFFFKQIKKQELRGKVISQSHLLEWK